LSREPHRDRQKRARRGPGAKHPHADQLPVARHAGGGFDHEPPCQVSTWPPQSLAAQNRADVPHFEAHLRGKLAYLHMIDPEKAAPMLARLARLLDGDQEGPPAQVP